MIEQPTPVDKADLLAAWRVLENLAVSFDQIGGRFGRDTDGVNGSKDQGALQEALLSYVTPELVAAINEARRRLGRYIVDEDAERIAESIPYWDCVPSSRAGNNRR